MTTTMNAVTANTGEATPSKSMKPPLKELSPHSLAKKVLKEAWKERERGNEPDAAGAASNAPPSKRHKSSSSTGTTGGADEEGWKQELDDTWKNVEDETMEIEEAYNATKMLLGNQIESLIHAGLGAFHQLENTSRELQLIKEELESKSLELIRHRLAEEKNRATITNLLCAVEVSKTEARDTSRAAISEAGLRAELSIMLSKRDEAFGNAAEFKRKATLLDQELHQVKTKLSRVTQDKIKMERDQRATMSLAKSLDIHISSDVDFYKRKVTELNSHVQGLNGVIAEKNRHIDEMRRQIERSMSQNRLANLRASESGRGRQRSL